MATGRSGTLYMEAWSAQHELPGRQNDSQELQNETRERQDGPSQCSIGYSDGPWQPTLRPHMLPKANFNVPGSLWGRFWLYPNSYLGGSFINFEETIQLHSIPFRLHSVPFHSIPFNSLPFHSISFHCVQFHSTPPDSIPLPFRSTPFQGSGLPELRNRLLPRYRFAGFLTSSL